jgi:hypothetical protein
MQCICFQTYALKHMDDRLAMFPVLLRSVDNQWFRDNISYLHARIQGSKRILENHLHLRSERY